MVRGAVLTGAGVDDSLAVRALVQRDERMVLAGEAHDSISRRRVLTDASIAAMPDAGPHPGSTR